MFYCRSSAVNFKTIFRIWCSLFEFCDVFILSVESNALEIRHVICCSDEGALCPESTIYGATRTTMFNDDVLFAIRSLRHFESRLCLTWCIVFHTAVERGARAANSAPCIPGRLQLSQTCSCLRKACDRLYLVSLFFGAGNTQHFPICANNTT